MSSFAILAYFSWQNGQLGIVLIEYYDSQSVKLLEILKKRGNKDFLRFEHIHMCIFIFIT